MTDARFQLVYFAPNPVIEWDVPIGAILREAGALRFIQFQGTLPVGLNPKALALLNAVLPSFQRIRTRKDFDETSLSAGPHFTFGQIRLVPSLIPDAEAWVRGLFREC